MKELEDFPKDKEIFYQIKDEITYNCDYNSKRKCKCCG